MTDTKTLHSMAEGLLALAEYLESHPGFSEKVYVNPIQARIFPGTKEEMAELAKQMGGFTKSSAIGYLDLQKNFGPVLFEITMRHEDICTAKVTGTRTVTKPAPDAPMIEVEEPIIEWECPPSILAFAEAS